MPGSARGQFWPGMHGGGGGGQAVGVGQRGLARAAIDDDGRLGLGRLRRVGGGRSSAGVSGGRVTTGSLAAQGAVRSGRGRFAPAAVPGGVVPRDCSIGAAAARLAEQAAGATGSQAR